MKHGSTLPKQRTCRICGRRRGSADSFGNLAGAERSCDGASLCVGNLNENEVLTETAVLIALGFFAVFIIYSIFQVSVLKRLSSTV